MIPRPNQYVGVTTYTGTSANPATVTDPENIDFTPDFVWCKYRDGTEGHALYDSVRGPLYRLRSNTNDQQTTGSNELKSFIPGGFTTGKMDTFIIIITSLYHGCGKLVEQKEPLMLMTKVMQVLLRQVLQMEQ